MKITEVSHLYHISCDTLRYYEKIGLLPRITRNKSGIRDYNEEDLKWVEFIKCMRSVGLPIESLIEYVQLFHEGDSSIPARKEILVTERDKLALKIEEMQKMYEHLNRKIEIYDKTLLEKERALKQA